MVANPSFFEIIATMNTLVCERHSRGGGASNTHTKKKKNLGNGQTEGLLSASKIAPFLKSEKASTYTQLLKQQ